MSSSIESLLAAVQGKELQNRRISTAILIFTVIASLVTIGILHSWYPWWCAFSALVLLGTFALYLIRAGVRPWAVSPEEVAILVDAALPTKERCSALLSLRSSLDPIDTARSLFISQQLSEILAEGPHPAQIAPFKLSGSERCALITALLLTLSAILLFVFRPQPKLLALAAKIESILAADPTIPEPLRAQALALAEAIKDTPLGSSQINMELNGARKELEQALAESERGKSLGERTVQGSKETREYPQEPKQKQKQKQATPIPVPPTPGPHEQKKQEPQEEKQQGKEQQKPGAQEQKEEEQKKKEQGKEEQSANEQSGSGQGAEKEESGDNPSQQGSEQQEKAGEQKQQGGSDQGESAADKDPSAKEQGGQQGDGDGQGSGKGAGEGEGKGKGGEGKGVGSGDGKGQGSGESSDSDSSSANTGSAEASSGTTGKQDQGKQGSAGQEGAQSGSSASGSQSSSLQQLEAALNEVEQGVKQQGQGQEGTGAEKGPQSKPPSPSQSGLQAGAQGTGSKGAGKGEAKEPSKSDPEKSENSNSDSKQAKEGSDSESSDKAKQKPSEKTENEEQGEQDSNGERSAPPDRDAPAQTGGLSDGAGSAGLGSNQGFKEAPIGSLKEAIDERFTDESSNLEKNLEPAQAKTTIEDLPLAKPKGSLQRGEQPIPLEYSDILKGP